MLNGNPAELMKGPPHCLDCGAILDPRWPSCAVCDAKAEARRKDVPDHSNWDVCTDPDNCTRCRTPQHHRGALPHIGLSAALERMLDGVHIAAAKADATTSGGGKLSGKHYYRVDVPHPISPELQPYAAECADIIEALGMTFNEGEAFKALWRLAAARQGRAKQEGKAQYDADKAAHYAARVAVQEKQRGNPA